VDAISGRIVARSAQSPVDVVKVDALIVDGDGLRDQRSARGGIEILVGLLIDVRLILADGRAETIERDGGKRRALRIDGQADRIIAEFPLRIEFGRANFNRLAIAG